MRVGWPISASKRRQSGWASGQAVRAETLHWLETAPLARFRKSPWPRVWPRPASADSQSRSVAAQSMRAVVKSVCDYLGTLLAIFESAGQGPRIR